MLNLLRILTILLLIQFKAYALIEVDITRGNLNPLPIAVSPLSADKDSLIEFLSEDNGETATGRGLKFPLVISTSINA